VSRYLEPEEPSEGDTPLDGWRMTRALREVSTVYAQADEAYAKYSCPASADCCQLRKRGRQPWLWEPEWRMLEAELARQGRPLPIAPRPDGACPLLDASGQRCTVYAARPLGCRTYFCERRTGPEREPLARMVALSKRLERIAQEVAPGADGPRELMDWLKT
jgi:uncharacterized protein